MGLQPDYASETRLKRCRQIIGEIKPRYVNCPFGRPKIYQIAVGVLRRKDGSAYSNKGQKALDHPFRQAAGNLRLQAEKAINLSLYWPHEMKMWLIRFVMPLEMEFEFGNRTPILRDKMLALDVSPVAAKLFQKNRPIRLTLDTHRTRLIHRNTRNAK